MYFGMRKATKARNCFRKDFRELCDLRIEAGAKEMNYDSLNMRETLTRLHIGLDTKALANMAIWEPRTFRSIVGICAYKESLPHERSGFDKLPHGPGTKIISRGHL